MIRRHLKIALLASLIVAPAPALATHTVTSNGQTNVDHIAADFGSGGGTFTGALSSGELEFFTFFATVGDALTIRTNSVSGQFDTGLSLLFDPTGPTLASDAISSLNLLAEDDDSGGGFLSLINFTATQTGNFAFAVGGFSGSSGNFNVSLAGNTGVAAAVPEPGTWAMMLIGFGAIGFGMRRRRPAMITRAA